MVVIGIISAAAFAIGLAIWTDVMSREEDDRVLEVDYRADRFYRLADTAERFRDEFGREPSVREIYAAIEAEESTQEPDVVAIDPVIDLRARVLRIKESRAESLVA